MKYIIILFALFVITNDAMSQRAEWINTMSSYNQFRRDDKIQSVKVLDSIIYSSGSSFKYGTVLRNTPINGGIIYKNSLFTGDSIRTYPIGKYIAESWIIPFNRTLVVIYTNGQGNNTEFPYRVAASRYFYSNDSLGQMEPIRNYSDSPNPGTHGASSVTPLNHGKFGLMFNSPLNGRQSVLIAVADSNLNLVYERRYENIARPFGFSISPMPNGVMRLAGADSLGFFMVDYDSIGQEGPTIRNNFSPAFRFAIQDCYIDAFPDGGYVVSAVSTNGESGYYRYNDQNRLLWSYIDSGYMVRPKTHQDGSLLITCDRWMKKIDSSGRMVWKFTSRTDSLLLSYNRYGRPFINDAAYLPTGDAILAGYVADGILNTNAAAFLMRVNGLGRRYDPSDPRTYPTPIIERKAGSKRFVLYPNPTQDQFYVSVNQAIRIQVINALGQIVITQVVDKDMPVNATNLPSGLYTVLAEGYKAQSLVLSK